MSKEHPNIIIIKGGNFWYGVYKFPILDHDSIRAFDFAINYTNRVFSNEKQLTKIHSELMVRIKTGRSR